MRTLNLATQSALSADTVRPLLAAELDFGGGWLRVWTGVGPLVLGGNTFSGIGNFGGVSPVEDVAEVSARGLSFSISGVPSDLVSGVLSAQYRGRECKLWLAVFPESRAGIVGDPVLLFRGIMSDAEINDNGDTAEIKIQAENRLAVLSRPRVVRFTHEQQMQRFPGDRGLEYISKQSERPIYWGVPAPAGAAGGSPGGGGGGGGDGRPREEP